MSVQRSSETAVDGFDTLVSQWRLDHYSIAAADLDGETGQGGGQYDFQADLVSWGLAGGMRAGVEVAEILLVESRLDAWINSTETEDGTLQVVAEVGTDGDSRMVERGDTNIQTTDILASNIDRVDGTGTFDADLWSVLSAVAHAPFSDSATGVGGAGTAGHDEHVVDYRGWGGGPIVDGDDDDVFNHVGFRTWNVDDSAVHAQVLTHVVCDIDVAEHGTRFRD